MRTWNKFLYVVAMGFLAVATTSFGEGYYDPYGMNHGGFGPSVMNPYSRPVAPSYGGMGTSGTIANGGGAGVGMGMGTGYNPYLMNQSSLYGSMYGMNNMMFNPYLQPYLNSAPWGQYSPYTYNQWNNPWTSYWGNGYGNTMMNPYWGSSFQSPYYNNYSMYGQPNSWMYNNGIPGLGYNLGGLGTSNFYDWGLNGYGGYGNAGYSPYLGYNGFGYDNYGLGLGYGGGYNPYDYSGGFGGGYYGGGYGDIGLYGGYGGGVGVGVGIGGYGGGFGDYWY